MPKTFSEILSDINAKTKTSFLICVSMLVAGTILLISKHSVSWLFLCGGTALALSLFLKQKNLKEELAKAGDLEQFCRLFDSADSTRLELLGLTVCGDYAVLTLPSLRIYPMKNMEKFEVGLQGDVRKALFLTDKSGRRYKIAETQKGDALQEEFDMAYEAVRAYFNNRNEV